MSGNLVEVILRLRDEASGALRQVAQSAEEARARIGSLSDGLSQISRGLTGLGDSLGAILGSAGLTYALKSAADAAFEAQTGMQVLARTAAMAGVDFNELRSILDPLLKSLGVLPEQAAQATAQLLRAGFSVEQIAAAFQAGAASALLAGRSAAEGINNVAMALATGQSIYLNYIGIAENIGPVLQEVASSMQGASEEAIRQAQNQAALNVILNATKNEVASLPDLLGGYAGAQNRLNQSLYEAQKAIGEAVLPYLTALIELVNEAVQAFNDLDPEIKRLISTGAVAAGGVLGLATAIGLLLPVINNVKLVLGGLKTSLLALATNPITLVVAGAAAIAVAWARSADTADETRRRWALLAQAAIGLYDILKGVAQSIAGLFSSVGQLFSTIAAAFSKVLKGDFVGAWQEVQRGINLEVFAAKFEAANRSLTEGWRNLSSTVRGEVLDSTNQVLEKFQGLVDRVQGTAKATESLTAKLPDYSRAVGQAAGTSEKKEKVTKSLTDALDVLKKRYELGQISLDQYLAGLRGLLGQWEIHLQGLKEGTDEWKRYADAVLAAKRAIADATAAASRMTRTEQERRAPRDWSSVMTGPEVVGVEGWRDAILDTLRLGSTAYGQLMDQISVLEARLARGGLSQWAERELRALLDIAKKTAEDWKGEIEAAIEREQDDMVAKARALGESVGEAIAEGIAEGFSSTQNALAQRIQEELESLKLDILGGLLSQLEEDLAAVRVAVLTGVVPKSDLPQLLSDIADRAETMARSLYEAGELSASAFLQVWERIKRVREEVGALSQSPALPESETSSGFLLFLQGIPSEAEAALQTVRDLTYVMGPNELGEVIEANITYLQELQAQVPPTTREYQILSDAIGELRVMYLNLFPTVQSAGEEIQAQAEDYYDVVGGASAYAEEVRNLLDQLREGTLSQEQFNEALARLREDLAIILPVWEAWLKSQEEAGVNTEEARKALAQLQKVLANVGVEVQEASRQRLSAWASGLARDIQTAADAIFGLMGAFSAPSFGQGLATFARGVWGIVSLIPGLGPAVGSLVSTVGGILGSVVDGILNMFDSGWGKVQERIRQAAGRFKLISSEAFQGAVEAYQESYLFGLIRVTKYRINEALIESMQAIAGALEGGVLSGVRNAARAFMEGAANWAEALRTGIREAIANAVIEAVIQGAVIKGALGKLLDELTAPLAEGDYAGARAVAERIMAAIPAVQAGLENVLAPFRGFLGGGGGVAGGGTQAIRYELPTVTMASPSWVSEMGDHVAEFGAWVRELTERGVRVRVERESWSVLAAAIGG